MKYEVRDLIEEPILKGYPYGSYVYGCASTKSDLDYIVVVDSEDENLYYSVNTENFDFTVYSEKRFIERIEEHHISVMECIFQKPNDPYRKYFKLNSDKLRREISSVASNSFVKCKKKLRDGEDYIGKKSMFHSLRILMFGIQIAKHGEIVDYGEANHLLKPIMEMEKWKDIKKYCEPIYDSLKTDFKELALLDREKDEK